MKKLFTLLVGLTLAVCLFYFFYWSPVYRIKPLSLIPHNAAFILASSEPVTAWKGVHESDIWKHLQGNAAFRAITSEANSLDSIIRTNRWLDFVGDRELLIAAHPVQDSYEYLYIMDLAHAAHLQGIRYYLQTLLDDDFRITHRMFDGIDITEIYIIKDKKTIYLTFIENLVAASFTPALIESTIRQYTSPDPEDVYFTEITEELGFDGTLRTYVNFSEFIPFLDQYVENSYGGSLKKAIRYAGFILSLKQNRLSYGGYLNIDDTVNSYLNALYSAGEGTHEFLEMIPEQTPYFVALGFKNFSTFVENLEHALDNNPEQKKSYLENKKLTEDYLRVDLHKTFVNWVDNEVVLLQAQPVSLTGIEEYALLLKATDSTEAVNGLTTIRTQITKRTPVRVNSVDYKGYTIHYMALKGFFKVFLGKLFDKFEKPYYTIVGDWVMFSNHPRTLKSIIDAIVDKKTLLYNRDFEEHYSNLASRSSVFAYVNTPIFFHDLKTMIDEDERLKMDKNGEFIKCFSKISLQISPQSNGIFKAQLNTLFQDPSKGAANRQLLPVQTRAPELPVPALSAEFRYLQMLKDMDQLVIPDLSKDAFLSYYDNGQLRYDVSLKDGWKHGKFESFHSNGQPQFKGRYKEDKKDGLWRAYDETGKVILRLKFEDGRQVE